MLEMNLTEGSSYKQSHNFTVHFKTCTAKLHNQIK